MKTQNQSMGVKYTVLVSDRNNERKNKKGNIIFDFNCQIDYDVTPNNSYFAKLKQAEKEQALTSIGFYVGGLTDEAINYYYNKLITQI